MKLLLRVVREGGGTGTGLELTCLALVLVLELAHLTPPLLDGLLDPRVGARGRSRASPGSRR